MPDTNETPDASPYQKYVGLIGEPRMAEPLEEDGLRRFVQAIMDPDPAYYDADAAARSKPGRIVAPPLYPVHSFRRPLGTPDPLQAVSDDPDHDGIGGSSGTSQGLPPIPSPYKRLLHGGNEIEFFRCLAVGERAVAKPRYKSIDLKQTRNGEMLIVVIETRWETETGEPLMINRQTSLRR
jgi:N-terminal half of MaoC dehydratase